MNANAAEKHVHIEQFIFNVDVSEHVDATVENYEIHANTCMLTRSVTRPVDCWLVYVYITVNQIL
jgi:hypothetical protein